MLQFIILLMVNKTGAWEGHSEDTANTAAGLCQLTQHLTKMRCLFSFLRLLPHCDASEVEVIS